MAGTEAGVSCHHMLTLDHGMCLNVDAHTTTRWHWDVADVQTCVLASQHGSSGMWCLLTGIPTPLCGSSREWETRYIRYLAQGRR